MRLNANQKIALLFLCFVDLWPFGGPLQLEHLGSDVLFVHWSRAKVHLYLEKHISV